MTATTLQHILEINNPCTPTQVNQLLRLLEQSPWFTTARIALLKGMKQLNHADFEAQLNQAVLHIPNSKSFEEYLSKVKPIERLPFIVPSNIQPKEPEEIIPNDGFELIEVIPSKHSSSSIFSASDPMKPEEKSLTTDNSKNENSPCEPKEDKAFVTETLAEIYLKQGLIQEAEEIYTQLSLLYPEKKAYFASRFSDISQVTMQQT
ncbi:MAG: hypothetical protein ACRCSB_01370 [Bacteroidales bacterium]